MRIVLPAQHDTFRSTSPLNELVRRLARLAAPHAYSMTARLVGDRDASRIELKATRAAQGEFQEYACQVTLSALERDGADVVAEEFARAAHRALTHVSASGSGLSSVGKGHR
jgi:hypothetical protein